MGSTSTGFAGEGAGVPHFVHSLTAAIEASLQLTRACHAWHAYSRIFMHAHARMSRTFTHANVKDAGPSVGFSSLRSSLCVGSGTTFWRP